MRKYIQHPLAAGILCLLLIVLFHSPRWWLLVHESPGTCEWDRALSYLQQCEDPFRADVEPAMHWRFVPQVFVWAVGGDRAVGLAVPWLGVVALASFVFYRLRKHGYDVGTAFGLCTLLLSSAPTLVSLGWLGMNDAWVALGLAVLAFGERRLPILLACVLCPLIDERFVFGIPGAVLVRYYPFEGVRWRVILGCLLGALAPFLVYRAIGLALGRGGMSGFLLSSIQSSRAYLWCAPMGLWMAFRFAYVPPALRIHREFAQRRLACIALVSGCAVPTVVGFFLATDTMRTASILLPLCLWGVLGSQQVDRTWAYWLAFGNLVVPVAQVTYTKITPVNSILIELWRILR
ncbi:MAG TPA: hypothetical protein PLE80_10015 [Opitutaceae bacterium]|nr:hypothetical protein [Opitutaceae bacterium]